MSKKFMSFLDEMESGLADNTYVDDDLVESVEPEKVIPKKKVVKKATQSKIPSRDVSTKIIESRMRVKLDKLGLNESTIDDVVSEVLEDVNKVVGVKPKAKSKKVSPKVAPKQKTEQIAESKINTVVGRAESLLGDEPYSGPPAPTVADASQPVQEGVAQPVQQSSQFNDVANKASSLLS